jgi:hypothetical protein
MDGLDDMKKIVYETLLDGWMDELDEWWGVSIKEYHFS